MQAGDMAHGALLREQAKRDEGKGREDVDVGQPCASMCITPDFELADLPHLSSYLAPWVPR